MVAGELVAAVGGVLFLTLALKTLPVSVGYTVWIGAAAFGKQMSAAKAASIAAITGLRFGVGSA